jgi:16S rRNA (guanine1207-N2)-methyltransferase
MPSPELSAYRQPRQLAAELGDLSLTLVTRPGFPEWDQVTPATALLAAEAEIAPGERVLVGPCGHGALAVWAAHHTSPRNVTCLDTNWVAAQMARATCDRNDLAGVGVAAIAPHPDQGPWDVALLPMPKGRDLARLWLLNVALATAPGGRIYIAGANRGGVKSFMQDAETLLGPGALLSYKGGNRVAQFTRPTALPDPLPEPFRQPGLLEGAFATFGAPVAGAERTLYARPGVFSRDGLDEGTRLLLETVSVRPDEQALDLGCGYGVVGLHLALQAPQGSVTLVDVDSLACQCARETLAHNGVVGAPVLHGDGLAAVAGRTFTLIASNPPFHAGHAVSLEMTSAFIQESYDALERNGRLVLVANRFLTYQRMLEERFGHVDVLARTPQFQVLSAAKRRMPGPSGR